MARSQRTVGNAGLPDQQISQFAAQLIRRKARELASLPGFCPTDRDEIEQELRLVLLRRLDRFNPSLAHYNAFVTTVIERYSATILQHRRAESRTYRRCGSSLNQLVDDGDGNQIELGAVERVVEQAASGLNVAEFCRRRKLSSPTFYGWLRKLAAEPAVVTESNSLEGLEPRQLPFMPLELVERPSSGIRIQLASGAVLELPAERECLRVVLSVLSELETA